MRKIKQLKVISAGAGSGKTYSLMEELVALLQPQSDRPTVRPEGIIATTFTNKAAAELEERVRVKLLEKGLVAQADAIENAMIGTVHSLGVRLLKRFAFEAGVSPEVSIIADEDQQRLFNQSLDTVLKIEEINQLTRLSRLFRMEDPRSRKDWRNELYQLINTARSNKMDVDTLRESRDFSINSLLAFLPEPNKQSPAEWLEKLQQLIEASLIGLRGSEGSSKTKQRRINALSALRTEIENRGELDWGQWGKLAKNGYKFPKKEKEYVEELIDFAQLHGQHQGLHQNIRDFIQLLFDIGIRALEEYERYKKKRGLIDYVDMEVEILNLLEQPLVQEVLKEELDLLLVDEFQDTNPIQLEIFLRLTRLAKQAIWVGDPKQSIYGFRGAAPELMDAVLEHAGEVKTLDTSWRSREELVQSTNAIFTRAFERMPEERVALAAAPKHRISAQPIQLDTAVWYWAFEKPSKRQRKGWMESATARRIRELLDGPPVYIRERGNESQCRPLQPGDMAILCRTNAQCLALAEALSREGIQASIAQTGLLATAEIRLILACLKVIINERDALSVAELRRLASKESVQSIIESRRKFVEDTEPTQEVWGQDDKTIEKLLELRGEVQEMSSSEILNWVLEKMDLRRIVVQWGKAEQRLSNIDALRHLALQYEENCNRLQSAATLGGFLLWLDQLQSDDKDAQGSNEGPESIQVLTYHRSKGLEWPLVICHSLTGKLKNRVFGLGIEQTQKDIDLEQPLANRLLRYWLNPYGNQQQDTELTLAVQESPAYKASTASELAEEARLLYVGITRARDYLVIPEQLGQPTRWLNRVFHQGQEDIPTFAGSASICPWIWQAQEVDLKSDTSAFPEVFEYDKGQQRQGNSFYWPARRGEKSHDTADLDWLERFQRPPLAVVQEDSYGQLCSTGPDTDQAEALRLLQAFARIDRPQRAESEREALWAILQNQGKDLGNLDPKPLLQQAAAFQEHIAQWGSWQRKYPLTLQWQGQRAAFLLPYFQINAAQQHIQVIQDVAPDFQILEETARLSAWQKALEQQYPQVQRFSFYLNDLWKGCLYHCAL